VQLRGEVGGINRQTVRDHGPEPADLAADLSLALAGSTEFFGAFDLGA